MATEAQPRIERVLVADDDAQTRRVVEAHLVGAGYAVALAESGEQALALFTESRPDLVLLDVLMPGLNGFETCKRMRVLHGGAEVPVLFVSAVCDLGSHQQALECGADDCLPKPIHRAELLMRARSLLQLRQVRDELRQGYELIRCQRDALQIAQRQKEEFISYVVHDLKNPLASILANAEFLAEVSGLPNDCREAALDVRSASQSMHRLVMNLLDISRTDDGALSLRLGELDLRRLVEEVRRAMERIASDKRQELVASSELEQTLVHADRDLLRRLLENLVENAVKYSPPGGTIRILTRGAEGQVELKIIDEGPGVPEAFRDSIFEKYVRLDGQSAAGSSRGIGLTFCRLVAQLHGGRIWVEDHAPTGSAFCVRIPVRAEDAGS